jgi:CubicO group peptidase (beta-lactamase class C family)
MTTVALRLVQDGLLDLDRPMQRYKGFDEFCASAREGGGIFFSDFLCAGDRLTLRHVLSMTANGEPGTRFFYTRRSRCRAGDAISPRRNGPRRAV